MAHTSLRSRNSCLPASASSFAILTLALVSSCSRPPAVVGVATPEESAVSSAPVRLVATQDSVPIAAGTFWMQRLSVAYQPCNHLRPACRVASRAGIRERKTTERHVLQQAATATRSRALSPPDETTGSCSTSVNTCNLSSAQLLQHAQHGLRADATALAAVCPAADGASGQSQERQNRTVPAQEALLDEEATAQESAASMASIFTAGLGAVPSDNERVLVDDAVASGD